MNWSLLDHAVQFVILVYFIFATVLVWRTNAMQRQQLKEYASYLNYVADRLERVEPVPITILDGLGRDISHLNDEAPTT